MQLANLIEHLGVCLDGYRHRAFLDGCELRLTPTEYRLLECFLRAPGRAFSRDELTLTAISKADGVDKRTIDVHIKSLRKKLRYARELIETVQGIGYRFRENDR